MKPRCQHGVGYAFYVLIVRAPSISIEVRFYLDRDINRIKHGITETYTAALCSRLITSLTDTWRSAKNPRRMPRPEFPPHKAFSTNAT